MTGSISIRQSVMLPSSGPTAAAVGPITMNRGIVRTRQPQGSAGVNWGNPIARGLDMFFADVGGKSLIGTASMSLVTAPVRSVSAAGVGWSNPTSSDSLLAVNWPVLPDGQEYTYLAVFCVSSIATSDFIVNADNATRTLQFRIDTGTVGANVFNTAGTPIGAFGTTVRVGESHCAVVTATTATVSMFQQGRKTGSGAMSGTIKGSTAGQAEFGNRLGLVLHGSMTFICRWARALSASEAISVSANPWQLFTPTTQPIWGTR